MHSDFLEECWHVHLEVLGGFRLLHEMLLYGPEHRHPHLHELQLLQLVGRRCPRQVRPNGRILKCIGTELEDPDSTQVILMR
jgi:hypothetical protein